MDALVRTLQQNRGCRGEHTSDSKTPSDQAKPGEMGLTDEMPAQITRLEENERVVWWCEKSVEKKELESESSSTPHGEAFEAR